MKKLLIFSLGATLLSGMAYAAPIGPNFGLPPSWDLAASKGYGAFTAISANPGSAMCVECHTVNPSSRIPTPADPNGIGIASTDPDRQGSHVVMNSGAGLTATNSGGGFPGAHSGARDAGEYFAAAPTDFSSGGISRFNVDGGGAAGLQSIYQNDAVFAAATSSIICESCHSVTVNVGDQLILDTYVDNGDSQICLECHTANAGVSALGDFHTNDNLAAFDGSSVKRHHVLTGDLLIDDATHYNGGGTASLMWAPLASDQLDAAWCATPYDQTITPAITIAIASPGTAIGFRGACNIAGQGTRPAADVPSATLGGGAPVNDILPDPGEATVTCANCHRPHNAMSQGGAFILRTGDGATFTGVDGTGAGQTSADPPILYGIRRQADVGDWTTSKIYSEYLPLCKGCHQGYGN